MKKLRLENDARNVYDIEHVTKPVVLLKGVGNYCEICHKHLFNTRSKTCSGRCRKIKYRQNNLNPNNNSIQARISIKKIEGNIEYRILGLYLKKGVIHKIRITSAYPELWNILEKIQKFRDKPLEIVI